MSLISKRTVSHFKIYDILFQPGLRFRIHANAMFCWFWLDQECNDTESFENKLLTHYALNMEKQTTFIYIVFPKVRMRNIYW